MDTTTTTTDSRGIELHITGFGPFEGCPDNPTAALAQGLCSLSPPLLSSPALLHTAVVETSVVGVEHYAKELEGMVASSAARTVVLLHFGVNPCPGAVVGIERYAYNEMTFGVKDARGWQPPAGSAIDPACPPGAPLATRLPVGLLVARLDGTGGLTCRPSCNPGRYLCNCLYYHSLRIAAAANSAHSGSKRVYSLFCHVPPASASSHVALCRGLVALICAELHDRSAAGSDLRHRVAIREALPSDEPSGAKTPVPNAADGEQERLSLVAELEGVGVVGHALLELKKRAIVCLCVAEEWQGRGVATSMLREAVCRCAGQGEAAPVAYVPASVVGVASRAGFVPDAHRPPTCGGMVPVCCHRDT
eukprot:m51a1_g10134 hypothetical protein (363) ;mRNA; f:24456-26156